MGLTLPEAASLLQDASRVKYETAQAAQLKLNFSTCVVVDTARARRQHRGGQPQQFIAVGASTKRALLSFVPSSRHFVNLVAVRSLSQGRDLPLLKRCRWRTQLGVGVPFFPIRDDPSYTLVNALSNAVALYEMGVTSSSFDRAIFFPLLLNAAPSPSDSTIGATDAWLSSIRAVTPRSAKSIADDVAMLLRERCACFPRVEASGAPYNILSPRRRSVARWFRVRRAMLRSIEHLEHGMVPRAAGLALLDNQGPTTSSMLRHVLILRPRRDYRYRLDEGALTLQLARAGLSSQAVSFDADDERSLPHARRIALLSLSVGLVTAGRAWLAYLAFLPSDVRATAVVEIYDARCEGRRPRLFANDPIAKLADALLGKGRLIRVAAHTSNDDAGSSCNGQIKMNTSRTTTLHVDDPSADFAGLAGLLT